MPGEISLARGEYYAHPRNRFWPVMRELCGIELERPYVDRVRSLTECGVAVWDVLERCERPGSLDTSIVRDTEVPNDFSKLLARCASIGVVALNGAKAAQTFRRRVLPTLDAETTARLTLLEMPSTSPANASRSLADLVQTWSRLRPYLAEGRSNLP